jgi:hypothetical protein
MFRKAIMCMMFLVLPSLPLLSADHSVLLPRPQQVEYGAGNLRLQGLGIRVAQSSQEDLFAAQELAAGLSVRAGHVVEVREGRFAGPSILLKRTGAVDALPKPGEKAGPDSREASEILITAQGGEITSRSSAGIYYGVQTLLQMVEGSAAQAVLPQARVRDWPSLAYRGFMMDMSHCQLPKLEETKKQLDFLARWKTNQYYFYNEGTIQLDGYPLLALDGQMSQSQVREVIEYARLRHIDVIPCLELYGHTHDLFRLEEFSDLAVIPHGGEFDPQKPGVVDVLKDWIPQFARLFPSPFFHIGFDETWMLEIQAKKVGMKPEELYLQQFDRVARIVKEQGKIVMAWADMFEKYPSIVPRLPSDTILFPWHYSPLKDYNPVFGPFVKSNLRTVSTAAVKNWNWVVPDLYGTFENIDALLTAGRQNQTAGFLNTGWTDDSMVLMRMTLPGIAYGAAAAWQSSLPERARFFSEYSQVLYPDHALAGELAAALDSVSKAEQLLQQAMRSATIPLLWADPLAPENLERSEAKAKELRQARRWTEEAQKGFLKGLAADLDPVTLNAFLVGARMLDFTCLKHMYGAEIAGFWKILGPKPDREALRNYLNLETSAKYHVRTVDMQDLATELRERFREAWLREYTPFRLGVALGKWDKEFQYWLKMQERIERILRTFRQGDSLPPLETIDPR